MVIHRKEKHSFLGKNLFYLRKSREKTLGEMAEMLSLSGKSSYKAYEEDRALPDIHKIMKLASFFDVSVTELIYQDIEKVNPHNKKEQPKLFEIIKVPVKAAAGYARSFGDDSYIDKLKTIKIPYQPFGIARAFDIDGDSMEPEIKSGATVVGIKISASEIRDKTSYIVVTAEGVQCKKVRVDNKAGIIYLISKNEAYTPKHISMESVIEMWEVWKIL
jgi:phage repressor protein C with HTH and peptisase S24 domain